MPGDLLEQCHQDMTYFRIKLAFAKYLKESCDEQFFVKYFLYNVFVREISFIIIFIKHDIFLFFFFVKSNVTEKF